jgi:hypothetical protein
MSRKDKNRLIPEDKGRLVTIFLVNYFRRYLEYDFTADLEGQLDDVSAGTRDYKDVLDALLARFLGRDCRNIRIAHHRSAGKDRRGAGPASVSAARRMAATRAAAPNAAQGG